MEIDFDEALIIRIKLSNEELQDIIRGDRLFAELDNKLQLEIYHNPLVKTHTNPYLNGDHHESDSL